MVTSDQAQTILEKYGPFQVRIILAAFVSAFVCGPNVWLNIFIAYTPPHRCYIPALDDWAEGNTSSSSTYLDDGCVLSIPENVSINRCHQYIPIVIETDGKTEWSQCYQYDMPNNKGDVNKTATTCEQGWAYFSDKDNLVSATTEFNLVCGDSWLAPLVPTCLLLGLMAGSIVGGILADRCGRKLVALLSMILMCVSLALATFTPILIGVHISSFMLGFGDIVRTTTLTVLLSEVTPNKYRYRMTMMHILGMAVGSTLLPLLAYLLPNWRYTVGAVGVLQLMALIPSFIFLEESPRWLLENKKFDDAKKLLKKIAKLNHLKIDEAELLKLDNATDDLTKPQNKSSIKRRYSYIDLVKISFLRRRLLILSTAWLSVNFSYYGVSFNTNNLGGNRYITFLAMMVIEIPGHILSYITIQKLGSRVTYMVFSSLCGIFILIAPLLQTINEVAITVSSVIGKLFATGTFSLLYAFTGELFPTLLRNQSYGVCSVVSRISAVVVPSLLYLGEKYHASIPYLIMGTIACIAALSIYFLPETKCQPLPDTMKDAKLQNRYIPTITCKNKEKNNKENQLEIA